MVLMTSETLKRMWCAAEIASAYAAKTNIVLVSCDGNGFTKACVFARFRPGSEALEA